MNRRQSRTACNLTFRSLTASLSLALTVALPGTSLAVEPATPDERGATSGFTPSWGFEARLGVGFGGERVAEVDYDDGTTSELKLGNQTVLTAGPVFSPWRSGRHAVDLSLLLGWANESTGPENTDDRIGLSRFPVDLTAHYRLALGDDEPISVRLGGGVTYHLVTSISGEGSLEGYELDIDDGVGGVVELAFDYAGVSLGVRYTMISYRVTGTAEVLDASSLGLFVSLFIPPGASSR